MNPAAKPDGACEVVFQPMGKRVYVAPGTTVLEAGRRGGLMLAANCGGVGLCGKCRVALVEGELFPHTPAEITYLREWDEKQSVRLACEARVASSAVIEVAPSALSSESRLQIDAEQKELACDPMIEVISITADPPRPGDSRSDFARITDALSVSCSRRTWKMHPRTSVQLTTLAREVNWALTAYMRDEEIIGFCAANRPAAGLAIDLGTTKIAGYLVDLITCRQLSAAAMLNPQLRYGEDVISRLVYAQRGRQNAIELASVVREAVKTLADRLCRQGGVQSGQIADACIVGNTAMTHLLLNLPIDQLVHAPYTASNDGGLDLAVCELGWDFAPAARVHILPGVGGFVGSDHVAMVLACGIDRTEKVTVGVDIGTNTEIVVREPPTGALFSTSVPSGPAFEGGHVTEGMRADAGAIERVWSHGGALRFTTIGDGAPTGFCGSGVVDLIAELWRGEIIDERGHLRTDRPGVRRGRKGLEFVAIPEQQSGLGREIVVKQSDITQIQLAKAAVYSGIATLLEVAGIGFEAVQEVVVAGAFGAYLDLRNAIAIGLLPRLPNARYRQFGNAAGVGAKMALVSAAERERSRIVARTATWIQLKGYAKFGRLLARATRFPPFGRSSVA